MQRNGGRSRVDMDTVPPPSADGGRYAPNAIREAQPSLTAFLGDPTIFADGSLSESDRAV